MNIKLRNSSANKISKPFRSGPVANPVYYTSFTKIKKENEELTGKITRSNTPDRNGRLSIDSDISGELNSGSLTPGRVSRYGSRPCDNGIFAMASDYSPKKIDPHSVTATHLKFGYTLQSSEPVLQKNNLLICSPNVNQSLIKIKNDHHQSLKKEEQNHDRSVIQNAEKWLRDNKEMELKKKAAYAKEARAHLAYLDECRRQIIESKKQNNVKNRTGIFEEAQVRQSTPNQQNYTMRNKKQDSKLGFSHQIPTARDSVYGQDKKELGVSFAYIDKSKNDKKMSGIYPKNENRERDKIKYQENQIYGNDFDRLNRTYTEKADMYKDKLIQNKNDLKRNFYKTFDDSKTAKEEPKTGILKKGKVNVSQYTNYNKTSEKDKSRKEDLNQSNYSGRQMRVTYQSKSPIQDGNQSFSRNQIGEVEDMSPRYSENRPLNQSGYSLYSSNTKRDGTFEGYRDTNYTRSITPEKTERIGKVNIKELNSVRKMRKFAEATNYESQNKSVHTDYLQPLLELIK